MAISLAALFDQLKKILCLPKSVDFKVIDRQTGSEISRKTHVEPIGLRPYLHNFEDDTRVATFLLQLERRIGARVGARLEIWLAGHRVDGRRSVAGLR
jgi:hypothetical protein